MTVNAADGARERILIATDHAGFEMKEQVLTVLSNLGYNVEDFGTYSDASCDYPDFGHPLAKEISEGRATRGILLCGTGLGMSYVANRYPGVRAAVAWTPEIASLSRQHNNSNVLCIPARFVGEYEAESILRTWLTTEFEGGRHIRRIEKIERSSEG